MEVRTDVSRNNLSGINRSQQNIFNKAASAPPESRVAQITGLISINQISMVPLVNHKPQIIFDAVSDYGKITGKNIITN
jgi:hypothetical protein